MNLNFDYFEQLYKIYKEIYFLAEGNILPSKL
jgi:hypothetical protein